MVAQLGQTGWGRFRVMVDPWVGRWVFPATPTLTRNTLNSSFIWHFGWLYNSKLCFYGYVLVLTGLFGLWLIYLDMIKLKTGQCMTEFDKKKQFSNPVSSFWQFVLARLKDFVFSADICSCKCHKSFPRLLKNYEFWQSCRVQSRLFMWYGVCRVSPSFVCTRPKIYIDT